MNLLLTDVGSWTHRKGGHPAGLGGWGQENKVLMTVRTLQGLKHTGVIRES